MVLDDVALITLVEAMARSAGDSIEAAPRALQVLRWLAYTLCHGAELVVDELCLGIRVEVGVPTVQSFPLQGHSRRPE